jgi:hypothetical protein
MTTIYELTSWKYLFLYIGGFNCFGECQQKPRRKRLILMLTRIQRVSSSPFLAHDTSRHSQHTTCIMANHHRRKSSLDRAAIESIFKSREADQPAAPPNPHVGTSPNRALFAMSPPPRPVIKHSRALSYTPHRPNRLSLSFPVATSASSNESSKPTPTSSTAPSLPDTSAEVPDTSPSDSNGFLVALAGQERRVLELKEELEKAEADLDKLKRQWALHEAHKKKAEIKNVEQLQPLQTVMPGGNDEAANTPRRSTELDRRKALLTNLNVPKESRRKFSGSHTRALSLLSPERSNFTQSFPPVQESGAEGSGMPKSTTLPDINHVLRKMPARSRNSYHGGVTHGAKQIAEDIKAGMWTFLEDLRQATVGDEAVNGTTSRSTLDAPRNGPVRRGSKSSILTNDKGRRGHSPQAVSPRTWDSLTGNSPLLEAEGSIWSGMDQSHPTSRMPLSVKKTARPLSMTAPVDDLDDDWSNWDSPIPKSPRWSGSTTLSDPATPSNGNIEDRNVKYDSSPSLPSFIKTDRNRIMEQSTDGSSTPSKRDEIQWPALDKLSPGNIKGNLQRTMSTIMKEWEKSITPPPGDHEDPMKSVEKKTSNDTATQDELVMMSR